MKILLPLLGISSLCCLLSTPLTYGQTAPSPLESATMPPADTAAALTLDVQSVMKSPDLSLVPWEVVGAMGVDSFGVDFRTVDRVTIYFLPQTLGDDMVAAVTLNQPLNRSMLNSQEFQPGGPVKIEGHDFYRLRNFGGIGLLVTSPKTVWIGDSRSLSRLLRAEATPGPLWPQLQRFGGTGHLVLVVVPSAISELLEPLIADMPPQLQPDVRVLASKIKVLAARSQVNMNVNIPVVIETDSEADAQAVETSWNRLLDMAESQVKLMAAQNVEMSEDSPVVAADAKYVARMASSVRRLLTPTRNSGRLVLKFNDDLVNLLRGLSTYGSLKTGIFRMMQSGPGSSRGPRGPMMNFKELGIAMHNYHDSMRSFPHVDPSASRAGSQLSWRVVLLPFLGDPEATQLFNEFKHDQAWDSSHNLALLEKMPKIFEMPGTNIKPGYTVVQIPVGKQLFGQVGQKTRMSDITDGTSNTIMLATTVDEAAVPWTKPEEFNPLENLKLLRDIGGRTLITLADGSVHMIPLSVPPEILKALLTRDGGEIVDIPR